jgi:hypothetical protein
MFYGEDYKLPAGQMPLLRLKLAKWSEFMQDIEKLCGAIEKEKGTDSLCSFLWKYCR